MEHLANGVDPDDTYVAVHRFFILCVYIHFGASGQLIWCAESGLIFIPWVVRLHVEIIHGL